MIGLFPFLLSAVKQKRNALGFPASWATTARWCARRPRYTCSIAKKEPAASKKYPEIPVLRSYRLAPPEDFWAHFPFRPLPESPTTAINIPALKDLVMGMKGSVPESIYKRGMKLIEDLTFGAEAYQASELPPTTIQNADSAYQHGEFLTDKIALWVDSGFAAGPFETPP
jgi:hypothetical protein